MFSNKKWTIVFALLVIVSMVLSACATPTAEVVEKVVTQVVKETVIVAGTPQVIEKVVTATPESVEGPKRGGYLKMARGAVPTVMDPVWTDSNNDIWVFQNCFEPLVRADYQGTALEPALAESWEVSADGLVWTFHLRPGVKWHDGSSFKASDVVFALDRARTPEAGIWYWSLEYVGTIEAVDDLTVKITLTAPQANFLAMISMFSNSIVPQAGIEQYGEDEFFAKYSTGTGPFKMVEWVQGDHITLEKNPDYWQIAPDGKPYPYLDGFTILEMPEDTTRVLQVRSGDVELADYVPYSMIDELAADPTVNMVQFPSTGQRTFSINHRVPPMEDVKVRQAMNYAMDKQAVIDAILDGHGEISNSFRPKAGACWNAELEWYPYDVEKAKQLMAESTYPDGFKGLVYTPRSGRIIERDIGTMAKEMWKEIGIELTIEEQERATISEAYFADAHSMTMGGWTDDLMDAQQQTQYFALAPALHSGWSSERVKELYDATITEMDPEKRCDMFEEIQEIFRDEAVNIMLFRYSYRFVINPDVKDFRQIPLGWLRFMETWLDR